MTPKVHERETIAYEGNSETAGILDFNEDGSLIISEEALARYNSLIERYGYDKGRSIEKDFGVSKLENGTYSLTLEAAEIWFDFKQQSERERIDNAK